MPTVLVPNPFEQDNNHADKAPHGNSGSDGTLGLSSRSPASSGDREEPHQSIGFIGVRRACAPLWSWARSAPFDSAIRASAEQRPPEGTDGLGLSTFSLCEVLARPGTMATPR
jgi:hypothetical protein